MPAMVDTPTFQYKLEQSLSPESSSESLSCSYSSAYVSYQETGADNIVSYPPGTFGMELLNEINCGSVAEAPMSGEQPIGFEMTSKMSVGVSQQTVNNARLRYAGSMPSNVTGHNSNSSEESERISQWSQWLKGTAPPPVF